MKIKVWGELPVDTADMIHLEGNWYLLRDYGGAIRPHIYFHQTEDSWGQTTDPWGEPIDEFVQAGYPGIPTCPHCLILEERQESGGMVWHPPTGGMGFEGGSPRGDTSRYFYRGQEKLGEGIVSTSMRYFVQYFHIERA